MVNKNRHIGNTEKFITRKADIIKEYTAEEYEEYRTKIKSYGYKIEYSFTGKSCSGCLMDILLFPVFLIIPLIPLWIAWGFFREKEVRILSEDGSYSCYATANKNDKRLLNRYGFIYLFIVLFSIFMYMVGFGVIELRD